MPIKRIQRIAAIIFLFCLISPILIIFISHLIELFKVKSEEIIYTWATQSHVIIATIRYHAIAWITGLLGLIVFPRLRSIVWVKLLRFNSHYLFVGLMIALFCSGCFTLASGQHTTLYCERIQGTCELNRMGLWWSKKEQFSLYELRGAYVRVTHSDDTTNERVALVTERGDIPMTYSSSPGWQSETARQINAFVTKPNQKILQVRQDDLWISVIGGIIMMMISSTLLEIGRAHV